MCRYVCECECVSAYACVGVYMECLRVFACFCACVCVSEM